MDGVHQSAVDQILSAIEHGNLGVDETERRLQELIQAEQAKPTAEQDQHLINSAEKLREELHHRMVLSFEAKCQQDLDDTLWKYRAWKKQQHKQRRVYRIGALAAMILLCFGLGSGLLHWNWFDARISNDDEQCVIQGHEISLDTISQAIAAHDGVDEITTTDTEALCAFLGFNPAIPETLHSNWRAEKYAAYVYPDEIKIVVEYWDACQKLTMYYIQNYALSVEETMIAIEQEDGSGFNIQIDGNRIYICKNYDVWNASWIQGNKFCWIYGSFDKEILIDNLKCLLEE